jgi:hypothetical protein
MIHHASMCATDPAAVAAGLAELLAADMLRAPSPPLPAGSWFVSLRDQVGSLIQVLPADTVYRVDVPGGLARQEGPRCLPQSHFLIGTPLSQQSIDEIASRLKWRHGQVSAGLFEFTKVWVENHFLVGLMTPAQAEVYRRRFGLAERSRLEQRLREL